MTKNKDIYSEEYLNHGKLGERRKFAMADVSGRGKEVWFEVNWNSLVNRKGYIKISVDGHEAVVSREHLWAILFMFGSASEQTKMVSPFMKQTNVIKYQKMIGLTTTRDTKKGEMINTLLEFTLNPDTNQVIIGKGSDYQLRKAVRKVISKT